MAADNDADAIRTVIRQLQEQTYLWEPLIQQPDQIAQKC